MVINNYFVKLLIIINTHIMRAHVRSFISSARRSFHETASFLMRKGCQGGRATIFSSVCCSGFLCGLVVQVVGCGRGSPEPGRER